MVWWQRLILFSIFLASFGFAGGGYFLLFLIVPIEQWFVDIGWSQRQIDDVLKYFVFGWVVFGFIAAFLYDFFLLRQKKLAAALLIAGFTSVNAVFVLNMFLSVDSRLIALSRGAEDVVDDRFTFGPYPTETDMLRLKEEGYDGIITLLSPTIIFEKQLLDDEKKTGERIGLPIHSHPMLPWIGDNSQSINEIKALVADEEKRFYVHCYLGKHRVDFVRSLIMASNGEERDARMYLLHSSFQRGNVYDYAGERIYLGPLPTEEEWFTRAIRYRVEEIVSVIERDSPLFAEAEQTARESGIRFTSMPLDSSNPDLEQAKEIVDYVRGLKHKVYIHGFSEENRITLLEQLLRNNIDPIDFHVSEAWADGRGAQPLGAWGMIGPVPAAEDLRVLQQAGVDSVIFVGRSDAAQSPREAEAASAGLTFVSKIWEGEQGDLRTYYELAQQLLEMDKSFYLYADIQDPAFQETLHDILFGMYYGIDKSMEAFQLANGTATMIERNLVIGPPLTAEEWTSFMLRKGFTKVVLLHSHSLLQDEVVERQRAYAEQAGIEFEVIDMFESYAESVLNSVSVARKTVYLIANEEFEDMIIQSLKGR